MALYCIAKFGSGNEDLASAALGVIMCLSRLRNRLPILGTQSCVQQFIIFARSTVCPTLSQLSGQATSCPPNHARTLIIQAHLWQNIGYISHEMICCGNPLANEVGMRYLVELCSILNDSLEYCTQITNEQFSSAYRGSCSFSCIESLLYCVASYRGLGRCTVSLCPTVFSFFEATLLKLYIGIHHVVAASVKIDKLLDASRLLSEWVGMLADLAESTPLSALPQASLIVVLNIAQQTLHDLVCNHLKLLQSVRFAALSTATLDDIFIEILDQTLQFMVCTIVKLFLMRIIIS